MGTPVANPDRRSVAILLAGISLCLLCMGSKIEVPWLSRIGRHSYAIYLWHVFFTASIRIALHRAGINYLILDFWMGIALGLAGPMFIEQIFSGFKWPALLLLGKSVKKNRSEANSGVLAVAR